MRVFGLICGLLSLPILASTEITTQIFDIDYGQKTGDEVLVLLQSGHVAKLSQSSEALKIMFEKTRGDGDHWYKVKMDDKRYITMIAPVNAPYKAPRICKQDKQENPPYVPTTIENMATAKKYFREARYNPKESQCFNRAAIWTYEWWKKHSLKSNKILIYFTRTYIRRYNFEWWFHIAPLVHIMDDYGKVIERVMDRKYTSGPTEMTKWKNIFLRNDADCTIITKFSDYADYPYTGECFLQRTHMYTYQPADLQMYEAWGYYKPNFVKTEIEGAYKEAFDESVTLK